ncbi:protein of unknown function [Tenacibaculum sp. 190524A02b]|uniref:Natural product n=1 Tax=Tenacibaculum vairaonense TaxID=3137860 RepID=A0ABP1F9Y6_9FLAO
MKKQILNLGKSLNKVEQKLINGGGAPGVPGDATQEELYQWCIDTCNWKQETYQLREPETYSGCINSCETTYA